MIVCRTFFGVHFQPEIRQRHIQCQRDRRSVTNIFGHRRQRRPRRLIIISTTTFTIPPPLPNIIRDNGHKNICALIIALSRFMANDESLFCPKTRLAPNRILLLSSRRTVQVWVDRAIVCLVCWQPDDTDSDTLLFLLGCLWVGYQTHRKWEVLEYRSNWWAHEGHADNIL